MLDSEASLKEQISRDISIRESAWLLIGRHGYTDICKYTDLLAIDAIGDGINELKKHKPPSEVKKAPRDTYWSVL